MARFLNPLRRWQQRVYLRGAAEQAARIEGFLQKQAPRDSSKEAPVFIFNASTRIHRLSLNGAYGMLAAWALRAAGQDVKYLVCDRGLLPCVLGTDRRSPETPPPCERCLDLSRVLFPASMVLPLTLDREEVNLRVAELGQLPLEGLVAWEDAGLPLGQLTLPSVRWVLRRHRLVDSTSVRRLYAGYLASAVALADALKAHLVTWRPRALVVFNGIFYPEAIARHLAKGQGIPVVTHEVGLQPHSAFFSHREATFREVDLPGDFVLTAEQEARLEEALASRFRGQFTMAGVRFWPEMKELPRSILQKRASYRRMVSVFTNVIFDTSQVHANALFDDMFAWLDDLASIVRRRTDTLFVIRAHPDETRPGKASQETVEAWFRRSGLDRLDHVVFVGPDEPISSYELIKASAFVLVYNSSVGLEASILGTPALCAGRARFTQAQTAYFPSSRAEYWRTLESLFTQEAPKAPEIHTRKARAFLHFELFRASLDLGPFLEPDPDLQGMVRFSEFPPERLAQGEVMRVIREGILGGEPFVLADRRPAGEFRANA